MGQCWITVTRVTGMMTCVAMRECKQFNDHGGREPAARAKEDVDLPRGGLDDSAAKVSR